MKYVLQTSYILAVIGIFLFYMGLRVANHNLLLLIPGIILFLVGFIPSLIIDKKQEKTANNKFFAWKQNLIDNGYKIEVDLSKAKVKSTNYTQEIEKPYQLQKYEGLDELAGRDTRVFKEVYQTVITYQTSLNGKSKLFHSDVLYKDEITVQFLIYNQKTTFIYVDKTNDKSYYFDLDFLSA